MDLAWHCSRLLVIAVVILRDTRIARRHSRPEGRWTIARELLRRESKHRGAVSWKFKNGLAKRQDGC
jgi:hypothetical protein